MVVFSVVDVLAFDVVSVLPRVIAAARVPTVKNFARVAASLITLNANLSAVCLSNVYMPITCRQVNALQHARCANMTPDTLQSGAMDAPIDQNV